MHILDRNTQLGDTDCSMLFACDSPDPFQLIAPVEARILISGNLSGIFSLLDTIIVIMIANDGSRMWRTLRHDQLISIGFLDVIVIIVTKIVHTDPATMGLG